MAKSKKKFPDLFKKTSKGAIQVWSQEVVDNVIKTKFGHVGGAQQTLSETISSGKNIGKKNETTPAEQAVAEAQSRWELKLKKGYVESADGAKNEEVSSVIEGGIFPMLAHVYEDNTKHAKYPGYIQPKLDGHRCIAVYANGKCTLWSRTRKKINSCPHIEKAIEDACAKSKVDNICIDGELYNHLYKDKFEDLTSLIRKSEPAEDHTEVKYYVYDIADTTQQQEARLLKRNSLFESLPEEINLVDTFVVDSEEEVYDKMFDFIDAGYEGAVFRNKNAMYVNKRSKDLLKVKKFKDGEFVVADVEEGRGKMAGHAVMICKSNTGLTFKVKMAATQEQLRDWFLHKDKVINKMLTIKYQGLTNSGIPRFPVGMRFREDV